MLSTSDAAADPAASVEGTVRFKAPWRVFSAEPLPGYRIKVAFVDGLVGEVHMVELLQSTEEGVFAPLLDERKFNRVHVHWGAVTWPGDLDLAPDAMYDDIKAEGVCRIGPFAG